MGTIVLTGDSPIERITLLLASHEPSSGVEGLQGVVRVWGLDFKPVGEVIPIPPK